MFQAANCFLYKHILSRDKQIAHFVRQEVVTGNNGADRYNLPALPKHHHSRCNSPMESNKFPMYEQEHKLDTAIHQLLKTPPCCYCPFCGPRQTLVLMMLMMSWMLLPLRNTRHALLLNIHHISWFHHCRLLQWNTCIFCRKE